MNQESPSLRVMLRRTSLTLKTLLATLVVGVVTWGVLDHWQTNHLKNLFHDELLHSVWQRALESRVTLERKIFTYRDALTLLASQKRLDSYLKSAAHKKQVRKGLRIHNAPPAWLPDQGLLNSLMPLPYLMLGDGEGRALELYHPITTPPPAKALLALHKHARRAGEAGVMISQVENTPYVIFVQPIESSRTPRVLIAATPLSDTFLMDQLGANEDDEGIIALASGSPERIIASNAPQVVLPGTMLGELEKEFIIAGKTFLNLQGQGGARTLVEMVSLVSSEVSVEKSRSILITERQQRAITAFVLILASLLIMLWVTRTIRLVSLRMAEFSKENLGVDLGLDSHHDELGTLSLRFSRLMAEMVTTRDDLREEIEERKRVESEVAKLSQAVEQSPAALMITDMESRILYVNPEFTRLTGFRPDEAIGRNPNLLKSGETSRDTFRELWAALLAGKTWQGVLRNQKKNGKRYWEKNTISPIRDPDGQITNYLAIKEDISAHIALEREIQLARDAAEAANQVKSEFLTHMSHEFRTPLNIIKGCVKMIRDNGDPLEEKRERHLDTISDGASHLAAMIQDLVDLSRVESEQFILHEEPCDISPLLAELHDEIEEKAQEKGLSLEMDISPTLPTEIMLDNARVQHALSNLLSNAVKFTHEGTITLNAWYDGEPTARSGTLHFVINDTGVGIPEEQIQAIFEPFNQGDLRSNIRGGVGLGLTITKRLVDLMEGTIHVTSEPDQGSTFHIQLPCRKVWRPQESFNPLGTTSKGDQQALLVSHNPVARMILKRILEELGLSTIELDGCQASSNFLENAQAARFVIIIMDCAHQPDGGMGEVMRIRLAETVNASTPILLLGEPTEQEENETPPPRLPEEVIILPKPLQRDQVVDAVQRYLQE
uniref:histidine kinase n=1 Tax=Magnetococcus massalia (strain MO-1) TaxID=451514 RepID=A0A1S7LFE2_MAGMO|nr:putative histidine kinase with PAS sensor domain [Candidatus Magnetococcus massalia]